MAHWVFLMAWTLHGIAHVGGVLVAWAPGGDQRFKTGNPWILPGKAYINGPVGKSWSFVWAAALLIIVYSSYALYSGADSWQEFARYGSVASLLAIVPWIRTRPIGITLGALFSAWMLAVLIVPLDGVITLIE